jgi:hypothetical protein
LREISVIRRLLALALLVPSLAFADYNVTVQTDHPTHYYHLAESSGTTVNDSGGTAFAGTYTGGFTLSQTGITGYPGNAAVAFNGTTGYVTYATGGGGGNATFYPNGGSGIGWTFETWVYPNGLANQVVGANFDTGATSFEWRVILVSDGTLGFITWQCGGGTYGNILGGTYNAGAWNHIVATTLGSGSGLTRQRLYVNNSLVSSLTSFSGTLCNSGQQTDIGRQPNNAFYLAGRMDEVAFYTDSGDGTGELTAAQVSSHYNCGFGGTGCIGGVGSFPFTVKRDPLPQLKPWSPKEWFVAMR